MNNNQIESGLLINELQLGAQLNIAVANGTRDKFNLLLSLLSPDVRDFSQFDLPKTKQGSLSKVELREAFSLPASQPLVNAGNSLQQAVRISHAIHQKDLSGIRLQSLLNNEAILSRVSNMTFDAEVVDNLSFLSQTRLKNLDMQDENLPNSANGVDYTLLTKYQELNLTENPIKVSYM
jgi:hypothetical protein